MGGQLYGKVVEDKIFDTEIEAEQWLYKYYTDKKKERLKNMDK